jgi:hypothetical protein
LEGNLAIKYNNSYQWFRIKATACTNLRDWSNYNIMDQVDVFPKVIRVVMWCAMNTSIISMAHQHPPCVVWVSIACMRVSELKHLQQN